MDAVQKFHSDARRILSRAPAEDAPRQLAELLEKSHPALRQLARAFAGYWLSAYGLSADAGLEKLGALHALLDGDTEGLDGRTAALSAADWAELCELTNLEAEDLPLDALDVLMGVFVEKRAIG